MQAEAIREWQMQITKYDDLKAFELLYTCFYSRLLRFAHSFTPQIETAEEVVEEVFIRLWRDRAGLCDIDNVLVHLFIAVRNQALHMLNWKSRDLLAYFETLPENLLPPPANPKPLLMTQQMAERLNKTVMALPPKCRIIFYLVCEEKLPYREAAAVLNIPSETVDAQMTIAIKKLAASITLSTTPLS